MTRKTPCSISLRYGGGKASITALIRKCLLLGQITTPCGSSQQNGKCFEGSAD